MNNFDCAINFNGNFFSDSQKKRSEPFSQIQSQYREILHIEPFLKSEFIGFEKFFNVSNLEPIFQKITEKQYYSLLTTFHLGNKEKYLIIITNLENKQLKIEVFIKKQLDANLFEKEFINSVNLNTYLILDEFKREIDTN